MEERKVAFAQFQNGDEIMLNNANYSHNCGKERKCLRCERLKNENYNTIYRELTKEDWTKQVKSIMSNW
jgi:hypothetical protein